MNDSSKRDAEIFTEALCLPEVERVPYLERTCGSDAALRGRVDGLLAAHKQLGNFLEDSPHPAPQQARAGAAIGEKPGDQIGLYRLVQQIGEGGCGIVFLAEQDVPVRRRVALKIIKPGMDSKSVIVRFEAERQALALMDHPNIAKIFDAGATDSGRPYFVMELVRGLKITEYCDQHSLTTEERLRLFVRVCHAIQHAHQKGVIHRDIKPSNILVTRTEQGDAMPMVIDFGIAKATTNQHLTDKTLFTALEMLIGTPAYMSPEQAALTSVDVDTRSDVYSLGVLLYELLTGSTPFDTGELLKAGLDEIRRVIREQEPVRPSTRLSNLTLQELTTVARRRHSEVPTLVRAVHGDLDWIVMTALEKDRARRYPTANGLALDIQRFLANDVISARPPSKLYKAQKIIGKNKVFFFGITFLFILLVVSLITTARWLMIERGAREQLRLSSEIARMDEQGYDLFYQARFAEEELTIIKAMKLRQKLPEDLISPLFDQVIILQAYEAEGKFDQIRPFFDEFVNESLLRRPGYRFPFEEAIDYLIRGQRWEDAYAFVEKLRRSNPDDPNVFHMLAPMRVRRNDVQGYRALCQEIVSHFSNTTDPYIADRTAKDCLILPLPGVDLGPVAALADLAVTQGSNSAAIANFRFCKALAEWRQGHYEGAIKWASLAQVGSGYLRADTSAIRAMSSFKLGRTEDAQAALNQSEKVLKQNVPHFPNELGRDWRDWIIAHALHEEAEQLINGTNGVSPNSSPK